MPILKMISLKAIRLNSIGLSIRLRMRNRSYAPSGNALMEYAVPATILLISAGVLMTLIDTGSLMANFYLAASGRSASSLSGTALQTKGLGENSYGDVDNGLSGFSSFGTLTPVAGTGGTLLYIGQVSRTAGRLIATNPEYLFP